MCGNKLAKEEKRMLAAAHEDRALGDGNGESNAGVGTRLANLVGRFHGSARKWPNDPKLSDAGAARPVLVGGTERSEIASRRGVRSEAKVAVVEAGAVTAEPVRCSAWFGDVRLVFIAWSSQRTDLENVVDGMMRKSSGGCDVIGCVDKKALHAVGNLGGSEALGKEVERYDKSGVSVPVGKMESDVSGALERDSAVHAQCSGDGVGNTRETKPLAKRSSAVAN